MIDQRGAERTGPILVVCWSRVSQPRGQTQLAELQTEDRHHGYPSEQAARRELAAGRARVELASAAHTADRADFYAIRTRPPRPEPADRGEPKDGWTFQARGNEIGAVAEALLTRVGRQPESVVSRNRSSHTPVETSPPSGKTSDLSRPVVLTSACRCQMASPPVRGYRIQCSRCMQRSRQRRGVTVERVEAPQLEGQRCRLRVRTNSLRPKAMHFFGCIRSKSSTVVPVSDEHSERR